MKRASPRLVTPAAGALGLEDSELLRSPPHNHEAEIQLLGAILSNNTAFERVADFLRPEMFTDARHARIFEACGKLFMRGQLASSVTLKNYFEQDSTLTEIGGVAYLGKLAKAAITIINCVQHAQIIRDLYLRRQVIAICEDGVNLAYAHDLETAADDLALETSTKLDALTSDVQDSGPRPLRDGLNMALEAVQRAVHADGGITGVTTGLTALDRKLGGLHGSDLVIIAGRPSMGKTALATKVAVEAARAYREGIRDGETAVSVLAGAKVLFYSHEMSGEQLAARWLADATGVSADRQRRGHVSTGEMHALVQASGTLQELPIWVDDTAALTIAKIRQRARRLRRSHGLGLIVIDYLQLIEGEGRSKGGDFNRVQEVSAISRGLKALAKELNVPVVALSQLTRQVEARDDKRPRLADLRESGSIEQDADQAIFLYRHEYYLRKEKPQKRPGQKQEAFDKAVNDWTQELEDCTGLAEAIIDKNRHGPLGVIKLAFDGPKTTFGDLPQDGGPAPAPPADPGDIASQEQHSLIR